MTSTAIIVTRLSDGLVVDANAAAERLFGYRIEEAVGARSLDLGIWVAPEDRAALAAALAEGRSLPDAETRMRMKDGRVLDVRYSADRIRLGGEDCLFTSVADITAEKAAEAARSSSLRAAASWPSSTRS